jgi:hypothetical protein
MLGPHNCTYETPCGWCTKWDKKCDRKISTSDINTRMVFDRCIDCGNYGWDMPQCRECNAENNYKYFHRKYNDNE